MGKIFGISDNPVSTIWSALNPVNYEKKEQPVTIIDRPVNKADTFVSTQKRSNSNSFIKMRNGFGKLMSHFSKKLLKK